MFSLLDWNISPNMRWFVRMADAGATATVELYNTEADALAAVNRVAYALGIPFGPDEEVVFLNDTTSPLYGGSVGKFNTTLPYHLRLNSTDGGPVRIDAIGPFTDLEAVEDALMLTEAVIRARAEYEINKGTHTKVTRTLRTAGHNPTLDIGDTVTFSSAKRGVASLRNRVAAITLEISIDDSHEVQFFDQLEIVEYEDFSRT